MHFWLNEPVPDFVALHSWRAIGVSTAAALGVVATFWIGDWRDVSATIATGLVIGAAWAEFGFPNDVEPDAIESLHNAMMMLWRDLCEWSAAGALGAWLTSRIRRGSRR